jgi:hypothetical protein
MMISRLAPAIYALFLTGCAATNSGVVPVGNGVFMVSRQAGAFPSGKEPLLAEALAEAKAMCASLGKSIKIITTNENMQAIGNFPKASVVFACV